MKSIQINLHDEILNILSQTGSPISDNIEEILVLELYREHKISAGKAAEILNLPLEKFINKSSDLGIPFIDYDFEDLKTELKAIL
jgi:predicted HTH domain antitoxin